MDTARYCINAPNVVCEEFDSEFVVLNLAIGTYFSFRNSGDVLWKVLMAGVAPRDIVSAISSSGRVPVEDVQAFLATLIDRELVRPDPSAPVTLLTPEFTQALAEISASPAMDVFEDLADLLLADPVHDTDPAIGWPAPKPPGA